MTKNNIKTILPLVALSVVAMSVLNTAPAFAATYHTDWVWSSHADHTNELDTNGSAPVAFVTSEIDNLPKATSTTAAQLKTEMENAVNDWNADTDAKLHRDDTTTFYFDNEVGTTNFSAGKYANTGLTQHWWFGNHDHLTKAIIDFNNDANDVKWDHNGDNSGSTPVELRIYNTMLHEMGHFIGLCGTYVGDNQSAGACTTVTTTDSAMRSYPWGGLRSITTGDVTEINNHY